jgi:hypothetical protein
VDQITDAIADVRPDGSQLTTRVPVDLERIVVGAVLPHLHGEGRRNG